MGLQPTRQSDARRTPVDFGERTGQMGVRAGVLRAPRPCREPLRWSRKECPNLASAIHTIETQAVEPVFFAVVPDSFMRRNGVAIVPPPRAEETVTDDYERPLLAPHDRWSF